MSRHSFDTVSFAFGAIFLLAGVMLLGGKPNTDALAWVGPAAAVGLGIVILLANLPLGRSPAEEGSDPED
ncbi:MAG TPA: hypothetical protein VFK61_01805 [Candidatus Limnocylindria bacterium]|jgi:hypothetical protein|nr:hypothetical protein [Candidatus Limnocylindria bacterium]